MERKPNFDDIEVKELKPVECVGVQSQVLHESELLDDFIILGHVAFFDFEDVNVIEVADVIRDKLGFGFIFQSSPSNFHVVVPALRSLQEIVEIKESIELDDDAHKDIGLKKGAWTLRVSEKGDKDRPEFIKYVQSDDANPKQETLSYPHLLWLSEVSDSGKADTLMNECKTVGDELNMVVYGTHENNHEVDK